MYAGHDRHDEHAGERGRSEEQAAAVDAAAKVRVHNPYATTYHQPTIFRSYCNG
jgi:hypothetical protein